MLTRFAELDGELDGGGAIEEKSWPGGAYGGRRRWWEEGVVACTKWKGLGCTADCVTGVLSRRGGCQSDSVRR